MAIVDPPVRAAARSLRRVTELGSAELRDEYETRYQSGSADSARFGEWRALCAEGKADHVIELVRALPEPPALVLEIGCGDGGLLSALAARGVGERLEGVDISARAVELAAQRPEIASVQRFDGTTLPYPDKACDLGVLSHVLEHVPDPLPLLADAARVCGAVVVEVPLEDNRSAARTSAERGREQLGHLHRLSRTDVAQLAGRAGLRVAGELADPLPAAIHTFWAEGAAARAKALTKAAVRRGLFTLSPAGAERAFTVHYACLLVESST
jgi:SAM-dependent methyltransferase